MKKILTSMLLASTLAVSAFGISAAASEGGTAYGKVPATDAKITVDGKKDAIYDKGLSVKIEIPETANKTQSGTTGTAKLLWNGTDTFFVYVEVKDKEVIMYEGTPKAWETDSVELFLDYSNTVTRTRDQYRIDVKNSATYYDTKEYANNDAKAFGFDGWATAATTDGYAVEFQIKAYNEPIKAGMNIGFHLMINDMVKEGRNMIHSDACLNTPAKFGFITLSADKVAVDAPKAPVDGNSAKTSDMGLVISALSFSVASGILHVIKKKR